MNFDQIIDRRGTSSTKWDKYAGQDILPLWVADMDFQSPPSVLAALHARIDHGIFGYTQAPASLIEAVQLYARQNYGWQIESDWLVWLPGLVQGLNLACRAVGQAGDAVVTATPVYPPFLRAPHLAQRELITVPLVTHGSRWLWDFSALEASIGISAFQAMCGSIPAAGLPFSTRHCGDSRRCAEASPRETMQILLLRPKPRIDADRLTVEARVLADTDSE